MGSIPLEGVPTNVAKVACLQTLTSRCVSGSGPETRAYSVLVIDDNPEDMRVLRLALKWMRFSSDVVVNVADNCESALNDLCDGAAPLPSIIVLDLERNGKRCLKALERLKQNRRTRGIPVIGLAGPVINDLNGAYAAQVNCVVRKPATVEEAELFWTRIERFWFSAVTLPAVPRS